VRTREKSTISWRCGHHYPIVVETTEGGKKRARCLGCEQAGPVRVDAPGAMRALKDEARYAQEVGA
jgi:hypothetical protein